MVWLQHAKWIYAAAGSGIAVGVFIYLQSERKCAQNSWTVNYNPSVKWDYNWDKRDFSSIIKPHKNDDSEQNGMSKEKKKSKSTASRHIFLIRHGHYENKAKSPEDKKLTELGRRQADYVGKRLKDFNFNYTKLIHSTLIRAIETSDIILKHLPSDLPVESDDMLQEGSPIPPEPPIGYFRPEYQFFKDGARIEGAFRKYFHRAKASQKSTSYEIIVCHTNVIRYFVCRALQIPPEAWMRFSLAHCSITWIVIRPDGRVGVRVLGDCGFIPKDDITPMAENSSAFRDKIY